MYLLYHFFVSSVRSGRLIYGDSFQNRNISREAIRYDIIFSLPMLHFEVILLQFQYPSSKYSSMVPSAQEPFQAKMVCYHGEVQSSEIWSKFLERPYNGKTFALYRRIISFGFGQRSTQIADDSFATFVRLQEHGTQAIS